MAMMNEIGLGHGFAEMPTPPGHSGAEVPAGESPVAELPVDELTMEELAMAAPSPEPAPQPVELPADTLVAFQAGLIFVTTGQVACNELGADLDQIALTPAMAWRIAAVLRETLQQPELQGRSAVVEAWNAEEAASMPAGRIALNELCVQISIEPLGAGARVTVGWHYVAGLIVSLEGAADWARGVR